MPMCTAPAEATSNRKHRLNLLLILSALLSALTGAAAGGRVPEVRLHQAAASVSLASVAASTVEGRVIRHPAPAGPGRVSPAPLISIRTIDIAGIIPLYMSRRRE